jgi:hypothetical protein
MSDQWVNQGESREDRFAETTAKPGSEASPGVYLGLGLCAAALSAVLRGIDMKKSATFVGQWAVPFLLLGIRTTFIQQSRGIRNVHSWGGQKTGFPRQELRDMAAEESYN